MRYDCVWAKSRFCLWRNCVDLARSTRMRMGPKTTRMFAHIVCLNVNVCVSLCQFAYIKPSRTRQHMCAGKIAMQTCSAFIKIANQHSNIYIHTFSKQILLRTFEHIRGKEAKRHTHTLEGGTEQQQPQYCIEFESGISSGTRYMSFLLAWRSPTVNHVNSRKVNERNL